MKNQLKLWMYINELSYFLPVRIRFKNITQSCILWSHFGVEQAVHGSTTSYSSPSAAFSLRVCDRILPCVSGNAPPRKAVAKIETSIGCSWWMVLNFGKGGRMQAVHIVRCRTLIPRQHGRHGRKNSSLLYTPRNSTSTPWPAHTLFFNVARASRYNAAPSFGRPCIFNAEVAAA